VDVGLACAQERFDVTRELHVVLEQEPVRGVGVNLQLCSWKRELAVILQRYTAAAVAEAW
jgi:hypothetical protein